MLDEAAVVPGTDGQKMSKSYGNTIDIFAEGKALEKSVMGIVTDSTPVEQPKNPDTCNVFALYKLFATRDRKWRNCAAKYRARAAFGYGEAKKMLLAKIDAYFAPARERRKQLAAQPRHRGGGAAAGAARARAVARVTLRLVRERLGMNQQPV